MFEDTPEFVARHIIREAKAYTDSLPPPFFQPGFTPLSIGLVVAPGTPIDLSQINELRRKALEVRRNIEELRDHADLGGADPKLAEFSAQLQKSYRDIYNRLSRHELDLRSLQEEVREVDQNKRGGDAPPPLRTAVLNVLDTPGSIEEPLQAGAARSNVAYPSKTLDPSGVPDPSPCGITMCTDGRPIASAAAALRSKCG